MRCYEKLLLWPINKTAVYTTQLNSVNDVNTIYLVYIRSARTALTKSTQPLGLSRVHTFFMKKIQNILYISKCPLFWFHSFAFKTFRYLSTFNTKRWRNLKHKDCTYSITILSNTIVWNTTKLFHSIFKGQTENEDKDHDLLYDKNFCWSQNFVGSLSGSH